MLIMFAFWLAIGIFYASMRILSLTAGTMAVTALDGGPIVARARQLGVVIVDDGFRARSHRDRWDGWNREGCRYG
jgi:hypothetical protein